MLMLPMRFHAAMMPPLCRRCRRHYATAFSLPSRYAADAAAASFAEIRHFDRCRDAALPPRCRHCFAYAIVFFARYDADAA